MPKEALHPLGGQVLRAQIMGDINLRFKMRREKG
jgi:hypothetical protein